MNTGNVKTQVTPTFPAKGEGGRDELSPREGKTKHTGRGIIQATPTSPVRGGSGRDEFHSWGLTKMYTRMY